VEGDAPAAAQEREIAAVTGMRLGVNLRPLVPTKIGGMESYARNVLAQVLRYGRDQLEAMIVFTSPRNHEALRFDDARVRQVLVPDEDAPKRILAELASAGADALFCPLVALEPQDSLIPSFVTIPDVQHEVYPHFFDPGTLAVLRDLYPTSAKLASRVFTLSDYSRQGLIRAYGVESQKIVVVGLDADDEFRRPSRDDERDEVRRRYRIPPRYVLYPAITWPHKNHRMLLHAVKAFNARRAPLGIVFTGSAGPAHDAVLREIDTLDLTGVTRLLGHISQRELACLYRDAFAMVCPSLFEGFGLPILESFNAGCPVVCSATTSCPEVAGAAAAYVDPEDPATIAAVLERLDASTVERERLVAAGRIEAAKFSWQATGRRTFETIQAVVGTTDRRLTLSEQWPTITVVTPSFNQGKFIGETIESVLGQGYPRVEYIVVDGGSTDGTQDVLRRYDGRVRWVSERDRGQADAVNKGVAMGHGEIIGWLNSDDTYAPGALERAARVCAARPDVAVVYGDADHVLEDGAHYGPYPTAAFNYQRLAERCFICQPAAFIRRRAFDAVGGVDVDLRFCMDYDLWIRLGRQHRFVYLGEVLAQSRLHAGGKTLGSSRAMIEEIMATVKQHYGVVPFEWVYKYADHRFNRAEREVFAAKRPSVLAFAASLVMALWLNRGRPAYWPQCLRHAAKRVLPLGLPRTYDFRERWADGWISRRYVTSVPAASDGRAVVIRGRHEMPGRRPLTLSIFANGVSLGAHVLRDHGPFTIHAACLPTDDGALRLEIIADRTFRPMYRGSRDPRPLSCIIDDVRVR
jgi:glycosyltransferase involved in cell wall biosynthesis